ncbi:cytochrome c [soil metagenome]
MALLPPAPRRLPPRPKRPPARVSRSFLLGLGVVTLLGAGVALSQTIGEVVRPPAPRLPANYQPTPPAFLADAAAGLAAAPNDPVTRGRYLAVAGDCAACHTAEGQAPFSGSRGLNTPFGVIYSSNLTGDVKTGVGRYTPETFWRAMHEGKNAEGHNLYPAFPYAYFTRISRADSDALLTYLKTVPAVEKRTPANRLPFPRNSRFMVAGWNLLFFKPAGLAPRTDQSPTWNRGAYLVEVLGHCGACHTPKNLLGADKPGQFLQGGLVDNWLSPNLTGQPRFGLGGWSEAEIVEFLKTGRNDRAHASGSMGEVISDSTSLMSDGDLEAMAVYLKSLPPGGGSPAIPNPDARAMNAGAAIYFDTCTACHKESGTGIKQIFPPLVGHSGLQQADATSTVRVVLEGARTTPTTSKPTPVSMPAFAWKLSDEQIADVTTYVRNSWGNRAPGVTPAQVRRLRDALHPQGTREQR